jgi:hypothetical protein
MRRITARSVCIAPHRALLLGASPFKDLTTDRWAVGCFMFLLEDALYTGLRRSIDYSWSYPSIYLLAPRRFHLYKNLFFVPLTSLSGSHFCFQTRWTFAKCWFPRRPLTSGNGGYKCSNRPRLTIKSKDVILCSNLLIKENSALLLVWFSSDRVGDGWSVDHLCGRSGTRGSVIDTHVRKPLTRRKAPIYAIECSDKLRMNGCYVECILEKIKKKGMIACIWKIVKIRLRGENYRKLKLRMNAQIMKLGLRGPSPWDAPPPLCPCPTTRRLRPME